MSDAPKTENHVKWNSVIVECEDGQMIRPASELCHKQRIGLLIVPFVNLENAIMGRSLMKAQYKILTVIENRGQKRAGSDKLIGIHADVFDADGFEIVPMVTANAQILLNDLRECSAFLRQNLSQQIVIGWNLSSVKLKDKETLQLLDTIAKGYRPNYIRFNADQGLICEIAKKTCATKTALPFDSDVESDYKVLEASRAVKLAKQPA